MHTKSDNSLFHIYFYIYINARYLEDVLVVLWSVESSISNNVFYELLVVLWKWRENWPKITSKCGKAASKLLHWTISHHHMSHMAPGNPSRCFPRWTWTVSKASWSVRWKQWDARRFGTSHRSSQSWTELWSKGPDLHFLYPSITAKVTCCPCDSRAPGIHRHAKHSQLFLMTK